MGIDHRRLYCKHHYTQDWCKNFHWRTEFTNRRKLLIGLSGGGTKAGCVGVRNKKFNGSIFNRNVSVVVRDMISKNEPLEFPPVELKACLSKDKQADSLKASDEFSYYPYSYDASSIQFKGGKSSKISCETIKDLADLIKPHQFVVCDWDPETLSMVVTKRVKIPNPQEANKKPNPFNGIDTEDVELMGQDVKSRVDDLYALLTEHIKPDPLVLEACLSEQVCPYLETNVMAAYRECRLEVVKKLDKKKEVCQCGLTWDTLTSSEYRQWLIHRKLVHDQKVEYACPKPGCNTYRQAFFNIFKLSSAITISN